jgi:predicted aminopeptidase
MKLSRTLVMLICALVLSGCQSVYYYGQAIDGQLRILMGREPIAKILDDPEASEKLKIRLSLILEIREFAQNQLYLPVKQNYLSYVELQRSYVVWNVIAAPEFSLAPKTWCYPIVGCVAYRGYFSEKDAQSYAGSLQKKNYDIYVGGVTAYSTLGWFDDPVLSTIIRLTDTQSAALIYHELAHHFNESFATAVEQEGVRRWLRVRRDPQIYDAYLQNYRQHRQFVELIMKYRRQFESLYQSKKTESEKRDQKAKLYYQLKRDHDILKQQWEGISRYDYWFNQPLNNAQMVSVLTYQDLVPAFVRLLNQKNGDIKQFYSACQKLGKMSKTDRYQYLTGYLDNQ